MALPRLRVCQERSAVRQQWPGSSQDVLRAHERLSWMEPWQLLWRRVDICSSSSISRSATTRSSRLRRSPILHARASCTLQSSTTDEQSWAVNYHAPAHVFDDDHVHGPSLSPPPVFRSPHFARQTPRFVVWLG